jgi:hypothetical protein
MPDQSDSLRARADQCRRLAKGVSTKELADALILMGEDYARQAAAAGEPAPPVFGRKLPEA